MFSKRGLCLFFVISSCRTMGCVFVCGSSVSSLIKNYYKKADYFFVIILKSTTFALDLYELSLNKVKRMILNRV